MAKIFVLIIVFFSFFGNLSAQDQNFDNSTISSYSFSNAHLLNLYSYNGVPQNQNDNEVIILINHGYVLGFSPYRKQPLWGLYQVSRSKDDVRYDRVHSFQDDIRIPDTARIGTETFGNGYHLGHIVPNSVITRQYGKLAQMETFLMSNISPQKGDLNTGVWLKLENKIREEYINDDLDNKEYQHIWVIVGPIFGETPDTITRKNGIKLPVPESFFAIIVDPQKYPFERASNANYMAFIFDQNLPLSQMLHTKFLVSIDDIEGKTGLNFFPLLTKYYQDKIEPQIADSIWE